MSRKDELLKVWKHENIGYIPCFPCDYNFLKPKYVRERSELQDGFDWFGVQWTYVPEGNAPMVTPGTKKLTDVTKWKEQIEFPNLSNYDWEKYGAEETSQWDRENKISLVMLIQGCFERTHELMGFEDAFIAMMTEPEAYQELINAIADYKVELIGLIAKYYRPDIIMMHDDYGTQKATFMSPDIWRKFFKKPLSRLVNAVHDHGLIYEHHSCGYIQPLIDDFVEIGIDALNPIQPVNNQAAIKAKYQGKLTFVGGEDSQGILERPGVTEEEIRAEIRRVYNLFGPGGGYANFPITIRYDYIPFMLDEHNKIATMFKDQ